MRILLITDNHSPTGGAENYFFDLKQRLKSMPGIEVYSLGFGPQVSHGDDFYVFKQLKSKLAKLISQFIAHPMMYRRLRRHLQHIQPDVIHLHNTKQHAAALLKAIKPYSVVQTIHDYGAICPTAHNIHKNHQPCATGIRKACFWQHQVKYRFLSYLALSAAFFKTRSQLKKIVKKYFAPSPQLVGYLQNNGFQSVSYIPPFKHGHVASDFTHVKPHHFLFAGNLGSHKGVDILLEEFALAHQKNPQLTLAIAGKGPCEKQLRHRINELGLEKSICFLGWQQQLTSDYLACAAVIFPSIWMEAFGLVITEAMHHARPVIGSNRGSPPWLIDDGKTGMIFDPVKKGDLADKLLSLAGNVPLIMELGLNGQRKLETLIDNQQVLRQIISAYEELARLKL